MSVQQEGHAALEAGLHAISVGESLEQREMGVTIELNRPPGESAWRSVSAEKVRKCVIALRAHLAIGKGPHPPRAVSPRLHRHPRAIRSLSAPWWPGLCHPVRGSMNPKERQTSFWPSPTDGGLIGVAALKSDQFVGYHQRR